MSARNSLSDRICDHMNDQHADSLCDYAEYYARLPPAIAQTAVLTAVTASKLTLMVTSPHGGKSSVNIPLIPPMSDLTESRERLVAMANEASKRLGRVPFKVTRWVPPGLVGCLVAAAVCFGYWSFQNGEIQFNKGGFVKERIFLGRFDAVTAVLAAYSTVLCFVILAIHMAECVWIHCTRLAKHDIKAGSHLWWQWIFGTFVEGVGSVKRFDAEVKRLEADSKKH